MPRALKSVKKAGTLLHGTYHFRAKANPFPLTGFFTLTLGNWCVRAWRCMNISVCLIKKLHNSLACRTSKLRVNYMRFIEASKRPLTIYGRKPHRGDQLAYAACPPRPCRMPHVFHRYLI